MSKVQGKVQLQHMQCCWFVQVFNNESHALNVYGQDVEVDYRGYEVTVENFIRVLTGTCDRLPPAPLS